MPDDSGPPPLLLASTSPYRRQLLGRLGIPFETEAPGVEESPRAHEQVRSMVSRLAHEKARAVAGRYPRAVVIGSDQVAVRGTTVLGKPGDTETARHQLLLCSDQEVRFLTAAVVIDGSRNAIEEHLDETRVAFRTLQPQEIDRYVDVEQPLDCAGGFKAEGLGISLFWRISSDDPTALTGLPLIWLAGALRRCGYAIP